MKTLVSFARHPKIALTALTLAAWSCAPASTSGTSIATACALPADQAGTLTAHWTTTPIPIALHVGDFTADETTQIAAAVTTWNTFMGVSAKISILDSGTGTFRTSTASAPSSATLCAMSDVSGSTYLQPIVIYKQTTWPYTSEQTAMALTTYCRNSAANGTSSATAGGVTVSNNPATDDSESRAAAATTATARDAATTIQAQLPTFKMAMTEINYQYFFTTSEVPDLQTIILHEFGHVIGLNHSCDNSAANGFPTCTASGANADYQAAVMYPVFGFDSTGAGQQRRALNDNDESRANCLYQP